MYGAFDECNGGVNERIINDVGASAGPVASRRRLFPSHQLYDDGYGAALPVGPMPDPGGPTPSVVSVSFYIMHHPPPV